MGTTAHTQKANSLELFVTLRFRLISLESDKAELTEFLTAFQNCDQDIHQSNV